MTTKDTRASQQLKNPDPELWRKVKAAAALAGQTMTEWVEDTIRKQLEKPDPTA